MKHLTVLIAFALAAWCQAPKPGVIVGGGSGNGGGSSPVAGTGINVSGDTVSLDTSFALSRATGASGVDNTCIPTSASATTFTCNMAGNALTAYTNGMRVMFRPDAACSGTPTLNINTLGAKNLYASDGTTGATCSSGLSYWLVYNSSLNGAAGGFVFPSSGGSGMTQAIVTQGSMIGICDNNDVIRNNSDWTFPQNSTGLAPALACQSPGAGNYRLPTAAFTAATDNEIVLYRTLAINRTGAFDLHLYLANNTSSGNVQFDVTKACYASGAAFDPALTYSDSQSISFTSSTTTFAYYSLTSMTIPSACASGDTMLIRIKRNNGVGGNSTGTLRLVRAYTVQRTN